MNFFHVFIAIWFSFFGVTQQVQIPLQVASDTPSVVTQEAPTEVSDISTAIRAVLPVTPVIEASSSQSELMPTIVIYVQVSSTTPSPTVPAVSGIISSSTNSMSDEVIKPVPQFTTKPTFTKSPDGSQTIASWETDIAAEGTFYLADQPTKGDDLDNYTPLEGSTNDVPKTSFELTFGSYQRPIFYAVKITADGISNIQKGQILAMPFAQ